MPQRLLDRFVQIVGILGLAAYLVINGASLIDAPIRSDGYSYYVYLPAWFVYDDATLQAVADDCCGGKFPAFTSIVRWPATGRWVNPHPIGVSVLMTPFFAVAHALTWWSNLPPDGFSLYYQHAAGLAGLAAAIVGLWFLKRLLVRWCAPSVALASLATISAGTNLFHYATFDSTFSHAFSFALVAALIETTDRWWRQPDWDVSLQLAVIAALIFLVRHPNAVYLLIVPLWSPQRVWERRRRLWQMAALAAFCVSPQLVLYKIATGHFFVSVYGQLGQFTFGAPRLLSVLFGTEKGLFFWSPVLALAAAGLFVDHPLIRHVRIAGCLTFAITAYLIASWSDWQFGGSFSHRGFTDSLAIAAVLIAGFFDWVARHNKAQVPVAVAVVLTCALSCAQMLQYWLGILPIANTSWAQYTHLFLRFR